MNINIKINGETPAKKNSRINLKNGRSIPSKRYTDWHTDAILQLRKQIKGELKISEPVFISLTFCHGDLRRRDSDNGCSSIMDMLTDAGVLLDDNWKIVQKISISNLYEKNNAYCNININSIGVSENGCD